MRFEVEATYENGVLKLDQSMPLEEHERVTVHVVPKADRSRDSVPKPSAASAAISQAADGDDERAIWDELAHTAMTYEERDELWRGQ